MPTSRKSRLLMLLLILVCTVGCDQTSKHIARTELRQRGSVTLPGGFGEFRLAENPGSFLSLGTSLPDSLRLWLLTVAVGLGLLALAAYLTRGAQLSRSSFTGLALVWAGGTSNLIDRVARHGLVTDFIFIRVRLLHTGIFNVADVMIMIGVAFLVCDLLKRRGNPLAKGPSDV
ncbi:MAG: signal peptidase II [Verrucomicrobiota bacterium]|nr:signal peptidase II [Verrucomicrobiota bacterium]